MPPGDVVKVAQSPSKSRTVSERHLGLRRERPHRSQRVAFNSLSWLKAGSGPRPETRCGLQRLASGSGPTRPVRGSGRTVAGLRPQAQTGREVSNQPRARGRADLAESLVGDWESCHATGAGDPHRPLWSSGSQEELGGHTEGTGDRADAGGDPPGGSLGSRQGCEDISTRKDTGLVTATGDVTRGAPEPGRTERETPSRGAGRRSAASRGSAGSRRPLGRVSRPPQWGLPRCVAGCARSRQVGGTKALCLWPGLRLRGDRATARISSSPKASSAGASAGAVGGSLRPRPHGGAVFPPAGPLAPWPHSGRERKIKSV